MVEKSSRLMESKLDGCLGTQGISMLSKPEERGGPRVDDSCILD